MQLPAVPGGLARRWGDTSSPLYHHKASARAAFTLLPLQEKGPPPESHTQAVLQPLGLAPQLGSTEHPNCSETTVPKAREHLSAGTVLK